MQERIYREAKVGTTDGTFRGQRYFNCEDGCGLFVPVSRLTLSTGKQAGAAAEEIGGQAKLTYAKVTSQDDSGPPSQNTRAKVKGTLAKAASTDGSPLLPPRSPNPRSPKQPSAYSKSASRDDVMSKRKSQESSMDPASTHPSRYHNGQRVAFHDTLGHRHYGVVRWTGRESATRKFDYMIVGIETVSSTLY